MVTRFSRELVGILGVEAPTELRLQGRAMARRQGGLEDTAAYRDRRAPRPGSRPFAAIDPSLAKGAMSRPDARDGVRMQNVVNRSIVSAVGRPLVRMSALSALFLADPGARRTLLGGWRSAHVREVQDGS